MRQMCFEQQFGGKAVLIPVVALTVWVAAMMTAAAENPPDGTLAIKSSFAVAAMSESIYSLYGTASVTPDLDNDVRQKLYDSALHATKRQKQEMNDAAIAADGKGDANLRRAWKALSAFHEAILTEGVEILKEKPQDAAAMLSQLNAIAQARNAKGEAYESFLVAVRRVPGGTLYFGE